MLLSEEDSLPNKLMLDELLNPFNINSKRSLKSDVSLPDEDLVEEVSAESPSKPSNSRLRVRTEGEIGLRKE